MTEYMQRDGARQARSRACSAYRAEARGLAGIVADALASPLSRCRSRPLHEGAPRALRSRKQPLRRSLCSQRRPRRTQRSGGPRPLPSALDQPPPPPLRRLCTGSSRPPPQAPRSAPPQQRRTATPRGVIASRNRPRVRPRPRAPPPAAAPPTSAALPLSLGPSAGHTAFLLSAALLLRRGAAAWARRSLPRSRARWLRG